MMNKQNLIESFFRDKGNRYAETSKKQLKIAIEDFFTFTDSELIDINKRIILDWINYCEW